MSNQNTNLATFDQLLADVTIAVKPILAITVSDAQSEAAAKSAAGQVATLLKEVEKRKKELQAPLKAQIEAISAAADKVNAVLAPPKDHLGKQLNAYSAELTRKRNEELRIQREKEDAERRKAADERRKAEEELRAKQEAERQKLEAMAREEARLAAAMTQASELFGKDAASKARALVEQKAAEERAAAEAKAQADQQERERLAEEARLTRENDERERALVEQRKAIEAQKVKGSRTEIKIVVVDAWEVPRELCRPPELIVAEVKRVYKSGVKTIPGLMITEEQNVAISREPVPPFKELA